MQGNKVMPTENTVAFRRKLSRLTLVLIALLLIVVAIGGAAYYCAQKPRDTSYGEVVWYDPEYQSMLLISVNDAQGECELTRSVSLFFTGMSEDGSYRAPKVYDANGKRVSCTSYVDALPCGTIVEIVGDGVWQYSSPAGYPGVSTIKVVGNRADFIAPYVNDFVAQAQALAEAENFTPLTLDDVGDDAKDTLAYREQKSAILATIYEQIDALEPLSIGEKSALSYAFDCALGWYY